MRNSVLILNPISGTGNKPKQLKRIEEYIKQKGIDCKIVETTHIGHATTIAQDYLQAGYKHFVVAGGDGTINEVAAALVHFNNTSLGIVASGSGNGLARHLNLPKKLDKALEIAFGNNTIAIDTGLLNGKPFFSIAGVGFDAYIAHKFAGMKKRGFRNYLKAVVNAYPSYKPQQYCIKFGKKTIETKALMVTFANSNQFGNNTSIAPKADLCDGMIDLCIMQKPAAIAAVAIAPMLFLKKMDKTRFLKIYQTNKATVKVALPAWIHLDGDPYELDKPEIAFELLPASLNIHV